VQERSGSQEPMGNAGRTDSGGAARTLVLATRNPDKQAELQALLADLPFRVVSGAELALPPVVEDAPTLEGNARKKALEVAAATGHLAVADDTGLEVEALGGAPGVRTARFAGEGATYDDNNRALLAALDGRPERERGARFRTVVALAEPGEAGEPARVLATSEGVLEGRIARAPRGGAGFGYDPIFLVVASGQTLAEIGPREKGRIGHRGRALAGIRGALVRLAGSARCAF